MFLRTLKCGEEKETGEDEGDGGGSGEGEAQVAELQHESIRQEGIRQEEHLQDARVLRWQGGGGHMRDSWTGYD